MPPVDPKNGASEAKMPPSVATSQYPAPDGVDAMPTTGLLRRLPPVDPWKTALPNEKMPPSLPRSQYPCNPPVGCSSTLNQSDLRPSLDWNVAPLTVTDAADPVTLTVWTRPPISPRPFLVSTSTDCSAP